MPTAEDNTCAHPRCTCPVSEGQQYCSPACEQDSKRGQTQDACNCNHQACARAA